MTVEEVSLHANAVYKAGEIKFQIRSCNDVSCDTEVFKGPTSEADYYETSTGQDLVNVASNQFFLYKAFFSTNTAGTSPELYNVTIEGHTIVEPAELNIDSAWVDWNGENKTMEGSGLSWSKTLTSLSEGDYIYRVYANDSYDNSNATEERTVTVKAYDVTFNITDSYTHEQLLTPPTIDINCNNSWSITGVGNPYGPVDFFKGDYECTFSKGGRYDKTIIFNADNDKVVEVPMSESKQLTVEEHSWLESLYNCWILGECTAYDLLVDTNLNVNKIWKQYLPTDESVVVSENVTSYVLSPTQNISLDYSVNVPVKEGYSDGDLLPIRVFYWFTDENGNCYNQDKQTTATNRAETPYCIPLMAQTLGPMNGNKEFKVDLRPNLLAGTYNITRSIEIDPKGVWINYGRGLLGTVTVLEGSTEPSITIGEVGTEFVEQQVEQEIGEEQNEKETKSSLSKITGNIIEDISSSVDNKIIVGVLCLIVFVLGIQTTVLYKLSRKK